MNYGGALLCRCEQGQKFNRDQQCVNEEDCFPETTAAAQTTTETVVKTTMAHAGMGMREETTTADATLTSTSTEKMTQERFYTDPKLRVKNIDLNFDAYARDFYRFINIA